jgi:dolichol-phosphate mannosyltransferase
MSHSVPRRQSIEIIVPLFNEAAIVQAFHDRLSEVVRPLPYRVRIRYIDDGSEDGTAELLGHIAAADPRVVVTSFTRNFGHQAALTAGLDLAEADAVITMDGDGQHPPELIPELLRQFEAGWEVVLSQRSDRAGRISLKQATSSAFYWVINHVADVRVRPAAADFRLLARPVVSELRRMREYHRFLRGMIAWMGFRTTVLPYVAGPRIGGGSKYSSRKMIRLASEAVFSFSLLPMWLTLGVGSLFLLFACAESVYVLSFWLTGRQAELVPGWSSLMFVLLITGAVLMIGLGTVGIYVGYIFQQVKDRPLYLIREGGKQAASGMPGPRPEIANPTKPTADSKRRRLK